MADQDDWEDAPADATQQPATPEADWVDAPGPESASEEPGMLSKGLSAVGKGLGYAGGIARTALANSPPATAIDLLRAYLGKKPAFAQPGDWTKALHGEAPRTADYLERLGVPEGGSLSDVLPDKISPYSTDGMIRKGGALDPTARGMAGFVGDVATDPLTYLPLTKLAEVPGALGKLGRMISQPVGETVEGLGSGAEGLAVRHLRPTPKVAQALGPEKLKDIGREALDSGAIGFGQKADTTAAKLANLKEQAGATIGDLVNSSSATVSPKILADKIETEVIAPLRGTAENRPLVSALEAKKDAILEHYGDTPMTAAQVEAEKRAVQDNINYFADPKAKQAAQMGLAHSLQTQTENMIPDAGFKAAKRAYGNLATAEKMADRTSALTDGGTGLMGHLADLGVGVPALEELLRGNPAGIPLVAARGLTKGRLASSGAVLLDKIGKLGRAIKASPTDAALRNLWGNMMNQNNGGNQ